MRVDIHGSGPTIALLPRRRARAHLFTPSGRGLLVAGLSIAALMVGVAALANRADTGPAPLTPYAWIGR